MDPKLEKLEQTVAQELENAKKPAESTREALIKKLTSRKFLMSLAGAITGIMGMLGCSDDVTKVVAFGIVTAASILGYIITEGKIDAAAVTSASEALSKILEMIAEMKSNQVTVQPVALNELTTSDGYVAAYSEIDPVSRAIYETPPNGATTITITKSGDDAAAVTTEHQ